MTITHRQTAWLLAALALFLILKLKLLPALLVGLLVYHLIHLIAGRLEIGKLSGRNAKILSVILVAGLVIALLVASVIGILTLLRAEGGGPAAFMAKLAGILESSRSSLPEWISSALPHDGGELKSYIAGWLREHSGELQSHGQGSRPYPRPCPDRHDHRRHAFAL